jgi:hypothetical protein
MSQIWLQVTQEESLNLKKSLLYSGGDLEKLVV